MVSLLLVSVCGLWKIFSELKESRNIWNSRLPFIWLWFEILCYKLIAKNAICYNANDITLCLKTHCFYIYTGCHTSACKHNSWQPRIRYRKKAVGPYRAIPIYQTLASCQCSVLSYLSTSIPHASYAITL